MIACLIGLASSLSIVYAAAAASASGLNIAWNDCLGVGGTTNKAFACNTNAGSNVVVVSFDPPATIPTVVGGSAVIDLQSASTPLPSWWQLAPGGCRDGALHLDLVGSSQGCADPWQGAATGSVSYLPGFGGPSRARIRVSWGFPEALAVQVEPGNEYFAFKLILDRTNSVGLGSCSGCVDPVCLLLTSVWLYQPLGVGDTPICYPLNANFLSWQGGAIGAPGCPPAQDPPQSDCLATPAVRRSWGLVKSLYR